MSIEQTPDLGILRIDADVQRRIEVYARAVGVTPSEVVRQAFEAYEASHNGTPPTETGEETVFDVLSRAGLIGCLKAASGTPTDLSTNPEFMEGFGRE